MAPVIKHDGNVARHVASFPGQGGTPPGYVAVTAGDEHLVLRSTVRRGASGEQVFVAPARFAAVPDLDPCNVKPSTARAFKLYWLVRDPARQRALIGLLVALAGLAMKAAADLGKTYPVIIVGDGGMAITTTLGYVLTAVGLLLTFDGAYSSTD